MKVNDSRIYAKAQSILTRLYGSNASFRDGQYEAIEAAITQHRVLVVQKTGWGKSLVYFVSTKILREQGRGVTFVVSPLIALMENQLAAARRVGLACEMLNSRVTPERREEIIKDLKDNKIDLIFTTPETLFSKLLQDNIADIKIGLFVIDEAHCISDWGHDFRLEYGNLINVIRTLPPNVPVLATTATANSRVVQDLEKQLGGNVTTFRGPLTRQSLSIQVLHMQTKAERYSWLLKNINSISGSGIIYCLTTRDCDYLAEFLNQNGISALPYHAKLTDEQAVEAEEAFMNNRIKALVATIKLGMGYDKGDIAFVIHFQMPANVVSYYQQIGRAGRSIDRAYTFLMCGKEDLDILNHFINTAFPTQSETEEVINAISQSNGLRITSLLARLNIGKDRAEKALEFLCNDGFVRKDGAYYYATPKKFVYNGEHYDEVIQTRRRETRQMQELSATSGCYSKFIANCLDDFTAEECGNCANCLRREIIPSFVPLEFKRKASEFINGKVGIISPRKMWAETKYTANTKIEFVNQTGYYIARYGDAGYGEMVQRDKHSEEKRFCEELLARSVEILKPLIAENQIEGITFVPSNRSDLVEDFAKRLAERCGIRFFDLLKKGEARPQKLMENSSHQCANAYSSFSVRDGETVPQKLILLDDIVDSGWTLTVCGYRLMAAGCAEVYPFALASSSKGV
ncbi:MAG: RecQ family ATP-dependent DNA helicase [Clostridia bacterium]|nr:RecQ family ATP-dependent DNA helicase [Clostridia bacterium]